MKKAVVLVVEGEALIRMSALDMVEDAGFEAIGACDADEAIAILERRNDISAVFTDILMCRTMTGLKLAKLIRDRWPPIHLILTSGMAAPKEHEFPANGRFIGKPYVAGQVAAALHEFFASHPASHEFSHEPRRDYGRMS